MGKIKKILEKVEQKDKMRNDLYCINRIEKEVLGLSEEVLKYITQQAGKPEKANSSLEKFVLSINDSYENGKFEKEIILGKINKFEQHILQVFDRYEDKIESTKDQEVQERFRAIKIKIRSILKEMKEVVKKYDDKGAIKSILCNKCTYISSDLEEYRYNLSNHFSYLKGAVDKYYEKKEKIVKGIAIGTAAATVVTLIGGGTYAIVDQVSTDRMEALAEIYGSEENIPEEVFNKFFKEFAGQIIARNNTKEKFKEFILATALKNMLNEEFEKDSLKVSIDGLIINYGKIEYIDKGDRGDEYIQKDGYKIDYATGGKSFDVEEFDVDRTVQKDGILNHEVENKEAKKVRAYLEGLSIEECMEIFRGDSKEREKFEKKFEKSILEIKNEVLKTLHQERAGDER